MNAQRQASSSAIRRRWYLHPRSFSLRIVSSTRGMSHTLSWVILWLQRVLRRHPRGKPPQTGFCMRSWPEASTCPSLRPKTCAVTHWVTSHCPSRQSRPTLEATTCQSSASRPAWPHQSHTTMARHTQRTTLYSKTRILPLQRVLSLERVLSRPATQGSMVATGISRRSMALGTDIQ